MKNLPFKIKEGDVSGLFGEIDTKRVSIAKDEKGKPRGFAFVEFWKFADLTAALEKKDYTLKNRKIEVVKSDREITEKHEKNEDNTEGRAPSERRDHEGKKDKGSRE